ncbi:hypothetical protein B0J14DRAFT_316769 [Halenospora varia]|nr:hypothetical protein B0J14DRAFT_316769 [Halenospora varia]
MKYSDIKCNTMNEKTDKTQESTPKERRNLFQRADDFLTRISMETWILETLGVLCGVACIVALIVILVHYDDKPRSVWASYLPINTIVSLLATIATTTLALPMESGLSQLKWMRYKSWKEGAPLEDMDLFDEASRSTVGRAYMLLKGRAGGLGSLGALVGLLALAFGVFLQQVVQFKSINRNVGQGISYRAANISDWQNNRLALRTGFYSGLYGNPQQLASMDALARCSTGNCTWPRSFKTMGFCSRCRNITENISYGTRTQTSTGNATASQLVQVPTYVCPNSTIPSVNKTGFPVISLQNGSSLSNTVLRVVSQPVPLGNLSVAQNSSTSISLPSCRLNSTDPWCTRPNITTPLINFGAMGASQPNNQINFEAGQNGQCPIISDPWAVECSIHLCSQTILPRVSDGEYSERIISDSTSYTLKPHLDVSGTTIPVGYDACLDDAPFCLNYDYLNSIYIWLQEQSFGGSVTVSISDLDVHDYSVNFDGDAIFGFWASANGSGANYQNTNDLETGIPKLFDRIATSMTNRIRLSPNAVQVNGTEWNSVVYIQVHWVWLILPVAVVLMTTVFLVLTIISNRRLKAPLWKSSTLALLAHGLDDRALRKLDVAGDDLLKAGEVSEDVNVHLLRGEGGSHRLAFSG